MYLVPVIFLSTIILVSAGEKLPTAIDCQHYVSLQGIVCSGLGYIPIAHWFWYIAGILTNLFLCDQSKLFHKPGRGCSQRLVSTVHTVDMLFFESGKEVWMDFSEHCNWSQHHMCVMAKYLQKQVLFAIVLVIIGS